MFDDRLRSDEASEAATADFGVAVDLGTTEIRVSLINHRSCQQVGTGLLPNPQARFGGDILARLAVATESETRAREIGELARGAIVEAMTSMCATGGVSLEDLREVAIVGNTAMLTLLTGEGFAQLLEPEAWNRKIECDFADPAGIRAAWGLNASCQLRVVQPMAGFIGSDLLAGILATELEHGPAGSVLLDFGANTEIALWDGSRLWATSAAGGPAFEWCGIRCGMPAVPGAIWRVSCAPAPKNFELEVVGDGVACGLCGSGLVDAVACMLRSGLLTENGRLSGNARSQNLVALDDRGDVIVTPHDIDALQRAKAGVAAAVQCLLAAAGLTLADIERVCVSGAFGNHLNVDNALSLGLLPPVDERSIELSGNTALAGCELVVCRERKYDSAASLGATVLNMSYLREYEDAFVGNLCLRPWDAADGPLAGGVHAGASHQGV